MSETYKSSFYNFFVPIQERGIALIYNSLFGGLYEIPYDEYLYLSEFTDGRAVQTDNVPSSYRQTFDKLVDTHYFVNSDTDEFEIYRNNYMTRNGNKRKTGRFAVTITPSLNCNLACRYCFQNGSEGQNLSPETMTQITRFLEDRIREQDENAEKRFVITWFGGEPLLAIHHLPDFSNQLIEICEKYGYEYSADIITNGTLLKNEVWDVLRRSRITALQVTLDGPAETHNIRRLPKGNNGNDYDAILKNLSAMPEGIHLAIRINCDRVVWSKIDILLDDLERYGIWPQKAKQINIALAFITTHENARFNDDSWKFGYAEFSEAETQFADIKLQHYNRWAAKNAKKPAKKFFKLPQYAFEECITAASANGFVFDAAGYIHKCWEDADKPQTRIGHVTDPYDSNSEDVQKWNSYTRLGNSMCVQCKLLPVCNGHCTKKMIEDEGNRHCTPWKYNIEKELRHQYIEKLDHPDLYVPFE